MVRVVSEIFDAWYDASKVHVDYDASIAAVITTMIFQRPLFKQMKATIQWKFSLGSELFELGNRVRAIIVITEKKLIAGIDLNLDLDYDTWSTVCFLLTTMSRGL